jgi:putative membrane protein
MTGHNHRNTKLALTMLCIGALGACTPSDRTATSDTAAARTDSAAGRLDSSATAAGNTMSDSAHANMASNAGWTNDRIFGFTHNADNGEIALGKLASTKATNSQVKAYARQMVTDHQAMMKESHAMMTKVNANVDSTWNDAKDLADNGRDKLKDLTDKEAGNDWDKNYIDSQVEIHQKVLDKLTDAAKNPTDSTLAKSLVKASGKVQEHLTKAQSIKATLK